MKKLSFPKSSRLRKSWEFNQVYSQGKRLHGPGFTIICRTNDRQESRIGISVGRKIRGAVKRNRIKRVIRESFRLRRDLYPPGADIVFAVRPDFRCASPQEVCRAVAPLTSRWIGTHEG
ncbi:MAG: ribonuclease P protein component [Desulfopila sp.]